MVTAKNRSTINTHQKTNDMKTTIEAYKKNVSFTDANKLVFIEISVENGSLSISGNYNGGGGQILDSIKPANDAQRKLIALWRKYHLNDMHAGTEEQEAALCSPEFEEFKAKITALIKQVDKIEKIVNGSFEDYCKFIGIPSSYSSAKHNHNNLKKVWSGGKVFPDGNIFKVTSNFLEFVKSIPKGMRPDFKWNSHVPPNKIKEMFGDSYSIQCAYLESKQLLHVPHPETGDPYEYGHAWLKRELPADIIEQIEAITAEFEAFEGSGFEKQANDLLKSLGIEFEANFKRHGKHFAEDKESRDVFTCEFSRARNSFVLSFGQSIANSDGKGGTPPTAYDVLACITKSDPGSFEDFCSEYGYDTNSRKAESIHASVCEEWQNVSDFFKPSEIEKLQDIA